MSLFNLLKDKLNLNDGLESQEIRKKKKKIVKRLLKKENRSLL